MISNCNFSLRSTYSFGCWQDGTGMLSGNHLATLFRQNLLHLTPAGNIHSKRYLGTCVSVANQSRKFQKGISHRCWVILAAQSFPLYSSKLASNIWTSNEFMSMRFLLLFFFFLQKWFWIMYCTKKSTYFEKFYELLSEQDKTFIPCHLYFTTGKNLIWFFFFP